ncbi:N-acetylmuramoyl-L-alanine amidase family protein [Hyphococcus sp.]|uniref:N-acetylmuramoyl-L-alanine amidase family protein n=1 Tax=Hyphococcus sp. TaxID=2038636 RepID=UPI003D0C4307
MMAGFFKASQRLMRIGAVLAAFIAGFFSAARAAELLDVRFGPSADATRIVFDLQGAPQYAISGDDLGQGRLFVDFLNLEGATAARNGMGHVAAVSFAREGRAGVRATFQFKKTAKIKEIFVIEPSPGVAKHRLVIDLQTGDKAAFLASLPVRQDSIAAIIEQVAGDAPEQKAPVPADTQTAAVTIPPAPSVKDDAFVVTEKKVVVIDPGHGGRDPGAQGQSGTFEKNVTYAAAEALADILKERGGYKVVLTRGKDETIRVEDRETFARKAGADLFISLHSDALHQPAVRGASVYTLSAEGAERSAKMVKTEGDGEVYNLNLKNYDGVVGDILLDQAQRVTLNNSSKFAQILINNLSGKTPMLNRSHRDGNLRVLLAADVPAVLLEMAFISNAKDEANLNSPVWRSRVMGAVADSIDAYFAAESRQRQAQLSPAAGQ